MNKKVTSIFANLGIIFWLIGFLAGDKEGAKQFLNQGLIPSILVLNSSLYCDKVLAACLIII